MNSDYEEFIKNFITKNICTEVLKLPKGENLDLCQVKLKFFNNKICLFIMNFQKLDNQLLKKGYQNFILKFEKIMKNGMEVIYSSHKSGSNMAKDIAYNEIRLKSLQDYHLMMGFVNDATNLWYQIE